MKVELPYRISALGPRCPFRKLSHRWSGRAKYVQSKVPDSCC